MTNSTPSRWRTFKGAGVLVSVLSLTALALPTFGAGGPEAPPFLVFSPLQFFEPASANRGPSFHGVTVGSSTKAQLSSTFGQPTGGKPDEPTWAGTDQCHRLDLKSIMARFDSNGVLAQLMVAFGRPENPASVKNALRLDTPTGTQKDAHGRGTIEVYKPSGAAILLTPRGVETVWLLPQKKDQTAADAEHGKAPPSKPDEDTAPPRASGSLPSLHVVRTWCEHNAQWKDGRTGFLLCARILGRGLKGKELKGWVTLRQRGRGRLRVSPSGLPDYGDEKGDFHRPFTDTVRFEPVTWNKFRVFVPYSALLLPAGKPQRCIVQFHAECAGLRSQSEAETVFPASAAAPVLQALRLARVGIRWCRTGPFDGPNPAAMEGPPVRPGQPGIEVTAQVEADGLGDLKRPVTVRVMLCREDGTAISGRPVGPDPNGPALPLEEKQTVSRPGPGRPVPPTVLWVDHAELALHPGREHRAIVVCVAESGGLMARTDRVAVVPALLAIAPAPNDK